MYENWTVNSFRANTQSPHIVRAWVHSQDNSSGKIRLVYANIVITEGADTAPPYGIFKMNFKFYDPSDLTTIQARGFLNAERNASGKVLLYFATEDKDSYDIQKATLDTTKPFQLPSMSSWIDPVIGSEPVVTTPPAVIGGVVQ
jgi:hypothetical protein